MSDWLELHDLWRAAESAPDERCLLFSIVQVEGSAYRRLGAHMLVTSGGRRAGTISAGCLERDVLARLPELMELQGPSLLQYNNTDDDPFALNRGCSGLITILVEPIRTASADRSPDFDNGLSPWDLTPNPLVGFGLARQTRRAVVLSTIVSTSDQGQLGKRILVSDDQIVHSSPIPESLLAEVVLQAQQCFANRRHAHSQTQGQYQSTAVAATDSSEPTDARHCHASGADGQGAKSKLQTRSQNEHTQTIVLFHEYIDTPVRLIIFGAQDDAVPLANLARAAGIDPVITDWRSGLLCASRIPVGASTQKMRGDELTQFATDGRTAFVIMSHDYEQDKEALLTLFNTPVRYVGVMGPRKRTEQMLAELALDPGNSRAGLFYPVGLDIGAETPAQIAISIVSEIMSQFTKTSGKRLSAKLAPIHTDAVPMHPVGQH